MKGIIITDLTFSSSYLTMVHGYTFPWVLFIWLNVLLLPNLMAQPTIEWDKTLGGNAEDRLTSLQQTSDGGYILGGLSNSNASGDKSENSQGTLDYWIVKLNAAGHKEWDNTIGEFFIALASLQQTSDGGYILGGTSIANAGGEKSEDSKGVLDYWVIKLNAAGQKEWDKTIGGNSIDVLSSIQQTSDGGYILGGYSTSSASGDKSESTMNGRFADYWVVKLNAAGHKEWDNTIGEFIHENLSAVQQTSNGGYILGGSSNSDAGADKSEDSKGGDYDYWVVKLNAAGQKEWDNTVGGNYTDALRSIQQTRDGGYILGGSSNSDAGADKSEGSKVVGRMDYWIVKLNAAGHKEWDKTIEEFNNTSASVQQTTDGGYILGGTSISDASEDKSENSKGADDYWVLKLDATGRKQWDKTLGGSESDLLTALQQTTDKGYVIGGFSRSGANGDKSGPFKGGADYWVIKLNNSGHKEWDKTIGGDAFEDLASVQQTVEGGFILGGTSISNASEDKSENSKGGVDYWVVKLSPETMLGCTLTLTTQVTQAEPWFGMFGAFTGAGAIDLSLMGGTAPYTYQWNAGATTQDLPTAVPEGFYTVIVTDAKGCTGQTTVYVGRKNDFLRVLSSHQNVSNTGSSDGAIDLNVIGGVEPATYQWSNGATTEDLTGLSAGTYTVLVTDAFGRKATTTVIISEPSTPLSLAIAHQNVSAADKQDGAVDLTIVGGVGPYTYRWNTGAVTEDLHYASPGYYSVTVTDANGATATAWVRVEVGRTPIMMVRQPITNDDVRAPAAGLTAYPNPAVSQVTISFTLPTSGKYRLELYDIRGAKVKTIAAGHAQANKAIQQDIPLPKSAQGVYLLKLLTDQGVASQRLLIQR